MRRALLLVLGLAAAACSSSPDRAAPGLLAEYFLAVQVGDEVEIAALLDDCREGRDCSSEIAGAQASIAAQRLLDFYRFDDDWGFGVVQAFSLGEGGFWQLDSLVPGEAGEGQERILATFTVRTQFRADETIGMHPRALIEYPVAPLGTVMRLQRGSSGPGALRDQLVEVTCEAELTKRPDGWRVAGLRILPDSAVYEKVSWRPE